jgi:quercetin dioxygenase-like cupin family protein
VQHPELRSSSGGPLEVAETGHWYTGNANDDADRYRGWLLGHFVDPAQAGPCSTRAVEVKWGLHPRGQTRAEWTRGDQRTTVVILVSGRFRLDLTVGSVTLQRQGDYVVWRPGIDHSWHAEQDSTVITIRWPSRPEAGTDAGPGLSGSND